MIKLNLSLNILGLLISILGGFFGAKGFFGEKNKDIHARSKLYYYNEEHFVSMVTQKYSGIYGFLLISIGAIIQLLVVVFEFKNMYLYITKNIFILIVILIFIVAELVISKSIKKIVNLAVSKIRIPIELKEYRDYINKISGEKSEVAKKIVKNSLDSIAKLLNINDYRCSKNKGFTREEYIVYKGEKFCEKYKIDDFSE